MIIKFDKYIKTIIFFSILPFTIYSQHINENLSLKLNEIQVIGSHNSYKKAIEPSLWKLIYTKDSLLAYALQYEHLALENQLDLGLRGLELDVNHDPLGGKYKNPLGLSILRQLGIEPEPYDIDNKLNQSGLKVFHIQDFDFRSDNLLFVDCLRAIKKWSKANNKHIPIIITINAKDDKINFKGTVVPLPFTKPALDSIDLEIRSVFSESELITPDFVIGNHSTLREAIRTNGWPKLEDVKGRVMFVLDETGKKLDNYLNSDKSLMGKVMFVNVVEDNDNAAIRIINDPIKDENYIKSLVKQGFIVRTRADAETIEARKNDYNRFEAAIRSNAQIISTDYYQSSRLFESSYQVIFKDGSYTRINSLLTKTPNEEKH